MSGAGRTTWYARDAAYLRRELIVELGEEHGPGGITIMDVLLGWAQEQRGNGELRGGWRSLAREAFVTIEDARTIVEHAAEIGALDDLLIEQDDRRFTCRVSGWMADQERGKAAFRKARQRERDGDGPAPDGGATRASHAEEGQVTSGGDESRKRPPSPQPNITRPDHRSPSPSVGSPSPQPGGAGNIAETVDQVLGILRGCARFTVDDVSTRTAVENAMCAVPDSDPIAAAHEAVVWASDPNHRKTNAGSVFLDALRKNKLTVLPGGQPPHRAGRDLTAYDVGREGLT